MSNNVNEIADDKNKDSLDDSSVMSKIACHYVSLPKVILKRIDDSLHPLNLGETIKLKQSSPAKVLKKQSIKKVSPKSKNIPVKNIVVKSNRKKVNLKTKKALSVLFQQAIGKKSSLKQPLTKSRLTKGLTNKLLTKTSPKTTVTTEKKGRGRPRKISQAQTKSTVKKAIIKTTPKVTKTVKKTSPQVKQKQLTPKMSAKHEDSMMEENSDSEKSFDEAADSIYKELIHSLDGTPSKVMSDPSIKKQKLSKNVIKLSSPSSAKKTGTVIKGGIIRKNPIPIQAKSKPQMKPNQAVASLNVNQIKNIMSSKVLGTQKIVTSPGLAVKQKQLLQTSKTPVQQVKQKAITVQSVEAINSKAKKPEPTALTPKIAAKQTATVTPLTKARKSFSTGPPKVNFNKVSKERESVGVVESEPVNLLSKLVGLPISASKLQVMSLSPQNKIVKPSTSPPPLTSIKNDNSKTQYVTPTTHEKDVTNKNALDLLKILGDDTEASTSQQIKETASKNSPNITNGNEIKNVSKSSAANQNEPLMDTEENETGEEKPRTIYDLIADINLVYPSWNLHIMPDTNTFCIAQISRGRLGIPVLKKCIELDEAYNAKVYVHQYHCKRFDGQYDSEESIIALIHEINALRA